MASYILYIVFGTPFKPRTSVLELSNFLVGGWVFESSDQLAAERNLPIIIQQGRNHDSKVGGSESGEARIEGAKRLRFEGEARIEGEARERAGEGSGEGLGEPLPRKFLEFRTSNRSIWCIVEKGIRKYSTYSPTNHRINNSICNVIKLNRPPC